MFTERKRCGEDCEQKNILDYNNPFDRSDNHIYIPHVRRTNESKCALCKCFGYILFFSSLMGFSLWGIVELTRESHK